LARCLSELEPAEARVLSEHYRDGRGCDEIAAAIGKSGPAVRKILQRLRERLRACVEKRMLAPGGTGP
jgi:DNA-directed RNA polymerase specialized sigma24 family protein